MFIPGYWIDAKGNIHNIRFMETRYLESVLQFLFRLADLARERDNLLALWAIYRKIEEVEEELLKRDDVVEDNIFIEEL